MQTMGSEYVLMLLWQWDDQVIVRPIELLWIKMGGLFLFNQEAHQQFKSPVVLQ